MWPCILTLRSKIASGELLPLIEMAILFGKLQTFGTKDRDPREWTASVAYYALVDLNQCKVTASMDAAADWFEITDRPQLLAFDHYDILELAIVRLRSRIRRSPIGVDLLPLKFTFSQLQKLYEAVLGQPLDRRNFLREWNKMGLLVDTGDL
jgi:8-oxo-dGTP diphosphatase